MRKVDVVPYDENWKTQYNKEVTNLRVILQSEILEVYHIGSTSIPGLSAKPIIDILVVVKDIARIDDYNGAMIELGYHPKGENGIKERRYFNKGGINRTHHLHIYEVGNEEIIRHLAFRDFLRAHQDVAAQYGSLKENLAERFPYDISSYIKGKEDFVRVTERKALIWHRKTGAIYVINIQRLTLDKSRRIIITSDIHANLTLFKKLLKKIKFSKEDYLFINGDLCEKGPNSLEILGYVRGLMSESENIFVTKGNCDVVHRYVLEGNEGILAYMRDCKYSILNEMIEIHGKSLDDFTSLKELADFYLKNFHDEISWLESLVTAYELDEHIIIHAGIGDKVSWDKTEEMTALYTRAFHEMTHQSNKTVIVGHWPVINYRPYQISSHVPLIDLDRRVISIDGGNQIKKDGQLNALIIEDGSYSYTYVDELESEVTILREFVDKKQRIGTVTYPNYELFIMNRSKYFTQCKNVNLGVEQWIKNEYIIEKDEKVYCKDDLSVTFLPVFEGETVKIIDDECDGYVLVKKSNGDVGWIPRQIVG